MDNNEPKDLPEQPKKDAPQVTQTPASNTEATISEQSNPKPKEARKQPIKGVRDARKIKDPSSDESPIPEASQSTVAETQSGSAKTETKTEPKAEDEDKQRPRRGRRGRKTNDNSGPSPQQNHNHPEQLKLDYKVVSKKAWKIFLGEVAEDGLGLIADKDAKEMAKRSFRVAEIFLEEEVRRQPKTQTRGRTNHKATKASPPATDEAEVSSPKTNEETTPQPEARQPKKKQTRKAAKRSKPANTTAKVEPSQTVTAEADQENTSAPEQKPQDSVAPST